MKIIHQGAEAILYLDKDKTLIKERIKKGYRVEQIDYKLRKFRTRREAKLLRNVQIPVPEVFYVDENNMKIKMEFLKGDVIKNILDKTSFLKRKSICKQIGQNIAKIHNNGIIHGDLTTSNMIWKKKQVYFIDFGLGFMSEKIEDKAVDLHLLKQALEAKHHKNFKQCFSSVLKGYKQSKNYQSIIQKLKAVESRGRYKKK